MQTTLPAESPVVIADGNIGIGGVMPTTATAWVWSSSMPMTFANAVEFVTSGSRTRICNSSEFGSSPKLIHGLPSVGEYTSDDVANALGSVHDAQSASVIAVPMSSATRAFTSMIAFSKLPVVTNLTPPASAAVSTEP